MKKIKDFSRVIGLIGRGGQYGPSNEISEEKWNQVFLSTFGNQAIPPFVFRNELPGFKQMAEKLGFRVIVANRGYNR